MNAALPVLAPDTLERLGRVASATLSTQLFKLGFRNTCLTGLRAVNPGLRMAGEALTLRFVPGREDLSTFENVTRADYPQRAAIEACRPGQVLVVEGRGVDGAAIGGDIYMTRLQVRGAAGCVVDANVRDYASIQALGLPVYARGPASPPHPARHLAVDWNVPIACSEVLVMPGDILVGDADGVVCIPRHLADEVARTGTELDALEAFVVEKIRAGAPVPGTYPPDEKTRAEYEAWRKARG
ncbi:MAG: ribonuclease activity regulator RraA [Burkholderiales bacterium]|nr:ribonuclease activity regulator RraA [Burkholderiales bacterium]